MSASDFTLSMIFVLERSFAVGFCPSIQMYSAVILAKGRFLLASGCGTIADERSLENLSHALARVRYDHAVSAQRFGAIHRRVGAPQQLIFLLIDGERRGRIGDELRHPDRDGEEAAQRQRR